MRGLHNCSSLYKMNRSEAVRTFCHQVHIIRTTKFFQDLRWCTSLYKINRSGAVTNFWVWLHIIHIFENKYSLFYKTIEKTGNFWSINPWESEKNFPEMWNENAHFVLRGWKGYCIISRAYDANRPVLSLGGERVETCFSIYARKMGCQIPIPLLISREDSLFES